MKNITGLIRYILQDLEVRGFSLKMIPGKEIKSGGDTFKGYCDSEKKAIQLAADCDNWWMVLAHEWAHSIQPIEKDTEWAYTYMSNKKKNKLKLLQAARIIQKTELDAEHRACKLLKQFHIPLPENYIQKVNAYVMSYEVGRRYDKWDMKASPSNEYEIYSKMPKRFVAIKNLGKLTSELEQLYLERIFK